METKRLSFDQTWVARWAGHEEKKPSNVKPGCHFTPAASFPWLPFVQIPFLFGWFWLGPARGIRSLKDSALVPSETGTLTSGMNWLKTPLGRLRVVGAWEGSSFLLLLCVAMPLKYFAGRPEFVRVVGMAHGVLFLLYVWAAIDAALAQKWPLKRTAAVLIASVLPAGPFVVERWLLRGEKPQA